MGHSPPGRSVNPARQASRPSSWAVASGLPPARHKRGNWGKLPRHGRTSAAIATRRGRVYARQVLTRSHLALLHRLARLFDDELKRLPGVRVARWLSVLVTVVSCAVILAHTNSGTRGVVRAAVEGLAWLSWLAAGVAALSAAHHWRDFQEPIRTLASDRGVPSVAVSQAVPLGLVRRLSVLVGIPSLGLAALAIGLTTELDLLGPRLVLLLGMPVYAVLLAAGLALLTQASAALARAPARLWLMTLVLGPHLLRELWPRTPSVISVYQWLLEQLLSIGATT